MTRLIGVGRVTFAALAIPNYRRYIAGQSVSLIGTWMQMAAQSWLVLSITGSATTLGLITTLAAAALAAEHGDGAAGHAGEPGGDVQGDPAQEQRRGRGDRDAADDGDGHRSGPRVAGGVAGPPTPRLERRRLQGHAPCFT